MKILVLKAYNNNPEYVLNVNNWSSLSKDINGTIIINLNRSNESYEIHKDHPSYEDTKDFYLMMKGL